MTQCQVIFNALALVQLYNARSTAERSNSRLKDEFGAKKTSGLHMLSKNHFLVVSFAIPSIYFTFFAFQLFF